ncbi:MAG: hypothetical protein IJT66_04725 [Clostridia bacterium]|nr:hypothetical protein [Clostridia bacterium]
MDNRYDDQVLEEMRPFLEEHSFRKTENGAFVNEQKAVRVAYDEPRQMYLLSVADVEDGKIGEFKELNAWLFDDSQNAKDAAAVGIDFVGDLRKNMGIKLKRSAANADVELPSFSKSGSVTVTGLTKKLLDVFPASKEDYKNHIASSGGNFLYLHFFGETIVPQLKTLLKSGNKKQVKKLFDLFEELYVKGDKDTVNALVAMLCAAAYEDEAAAGVIKEALAENKHFSAAFENLLPAFSKNKKLVSVLVNKAGLS